jgi:hypothetical protein
MVSWTTNAIMAWNGNKITDHGRSPLSMSNERLGMDKRMVDGTLRRQFVAVKRTWTTSWDNLPSTNTVAKGYKTVDGGWSGEEMEEFYYTTPGRFRLLLRRGSAIGKTPPPEALALGVKYEDNDFYGIDVMLTDFSKEVLRRGSVDFWNVSVSMEEV